MERHTPCCSTTSESALPGEPLYPVKQAREAVALQMAPSDATREQVLLAQADTRLDETAPPQARRGLERALEATQRRLTYANASAVEVEPAVPTPTTSAQASEEIAAAQRSVDVELFRGRPHVAKEVHQTAGRGLERAAAR